MLPIDSALIDLPSVAALCDTRQAESPTLEFKSILPTFDERGRFEFCKDVSAFANSGGGDIIFGIESVGDEAARLFPLTGETVDAATRRLLQILDAGVEPKLLGVEYLPVQIDGGFVFVVRVPASFEGPHWVKRQGTRNFYVRREVANIEMTYGEVKSAFDRTNSAIERSRLFRQSRSKRIIENDTLPRLAPGPSCVIHYLPLSSLSGRQSIDVKLLYRDYHSLIFNAWPNASTKLNLDGLSVGPVGALGRGQDGYVQVFREGLFEAVDLIGSEHENRHTIGASSLGEFIRDAIGKLMNCATRFGLRGAAIVGVSIHGLHGFTLVYRADPYGYAVADRNHLVFPGIQVERVPEGTEREAFIRMVLDSVWQAFDLEQCTLYDDQGRWNL